MLITDIHQNLQDISFVFSVLIQQTNYISYIHHNRRMCVGSVLLLYLSFIVGSLSFSFCFSASIRHIFLFFTSRSSTRLCTPSRGMNYSHITFGKVAPIRLYSTIFVTFDNICKLVLYIRRYEQLIISFELKS